jgi:DNA invertase Pin-like site-specific DNA recombinase|nr:MAG TPA: gamma delta Resolvase, site specific recombination [Caudoviricetes sp.]DAQ62680.1 MAG TPA: gamma delta Resolvase, site specific recombination [Caudoviricetes sp.]
MKIGYARVSTVDQNEARQMEALREDGVDRIYMDKKSGKDFNRPEYQKMISELHKGDVLVIHSIDRLGRNYEEIITEWRKITKEIEADIIVQDMPLLNTSQNKDLTGTLIADIVLQLLSYVAQRERENIRQRQKEGIAIAKARGKYKGRAKKEIDKKLFEDTKARWQNGEITKIQFAEIIGVSRGTLYKILGEEKDD